MTFNWQEFLTTIGGQVVLLGAVGYLIKTLVSSRLERETEAYKAELKRNSDIEIERLKSSLQMASVEHQIRFTKLHEQRVEILTRLSREIEEVPDAIQSGALGFSWTPNCDESESEITRRCV